MGTDREPSKHYHTYFNVIDYLFFRMAAPLSILLHSLFQLSIALSAQIIVKKISLYVILHPGVDHLIELLDQT